MPRSGSRPPLGERYAVVVSPLLTIPLALAWFLKPQADYLLRVYCTDLQALNTLIHEILLPHPGVARVLLTPGEQQFECGLQVADFCV